MAVSPPETARAKNLYRLSFAAICVVSLTILVTIGVRQYRAAAKAEATQKELQDSVGDIRKQLQSAEVSRRLTGEGYLQTKKLEVFAGSMSPGNIFKVNVETYNPGPGRIKEPYSESWIEILDSTGNDAAHRILSRYENEFIKPRERRYISGELKGVPEWLGVGETTWTTEETPPLTEQQVSALLNDSTRLFIVSFYAWTDSQGRKAFTWDCRWVQMQTLPKDYQDKDVVWQVCVE